MAAERDSTFEFSASDLNRLAHFSSEMYLMLFRLISVSSESLSPAFLITSSMFVLLGASCGNTWWNNVWGSVEYDVVWVGQSVG